MVSRPRARVLWLPVGGPCNVSCVDCPSTGGPALAPAAVQEAAEGARPAVVVITGPGEPTMRRDLSELVHAARRGGAVDVVLVTNGRALAYVRVAARLLSLGLSHVIVTVHRASEDAHDRTTRTPGSYRQTRAGLANLRSMNERGTTRLILRLPGKQPPGDETVEELASLASRVGGAALWIDAPAVSGRVTHMPVPVLQGTEVEGFLSHRERMSRSRQGHVQPRMLDDERAISMVVRTGCRNACNFCTTRIIQEANNATWPLDDLSVFHRSLQEGKRNDYELLRFVAIEPLEHPEIADLIRRAASLGYKRIEAWTSCRALADPRWARQLQEAGLTHLDVPLLGSRAQIHDAVARVEGSFTETMQGLDQALDRFHVKYHLVVTRPGLHDMGSILAMAADLGLCHPASVLVPSPSSEDPGIYRSFAARLSDLARACGSLPPDTSATLLERGLGTQIPPCILERTPGIDVRLIRSLTPPPMDWVRDGNMKEPGAALKLRSPCPLSGKCAAAQRCPGLHSIYIRVHGTSELSPL